jgi:hypothetical protein
MELGMVAKLAKQNATKVKPQLTTYQLTFATNPPPKPRKKKPYSTGRAGRKKHGGMGKSEAKRRMQEALAKGEKAAALEWESERLLDAGEGVTLAVARVNLLLAEIYEDAAAEIQVSGQDAQTAEEIALTLDEDGEADPKKDSGGVLSRIASERWVGHAKQVLVTSR